MTMASWDVVVDAAIPTGPPLAVGMVNSTPADKLKDQSNASLVAPV